MIEFALLAGVLTVVAVVLSRTDGVAVDNDAAVAAAMKSKTGSSFEQAVAVVFKHEGGWVNNPNDPGGETNMGITIRRIKEEGMGAADVGLANLEPGCLHKLTKWTATKLYWMWFWDRYGYARLNDQRVATKVFDCAVNTGGYRAHVIAQEAIGDVATAVKIDGVFGPATVAAINAIDPHVFVGAFARRQADFYKRLIAQRPTLAEFGRNWAKRAEWGVS